MMEKSPGQFAVEPSVVGEKNRDNLRKLDRKRGQRKRTEASGSQGVNGSSVTHVGKHGKRSKSAEGRGSQMRES